MFNGCYWCRSADNLCPDCHCGPEIARQHLQIPLEDPSPNGWDDDRQEHRYSEDLNLGLPVEDPSPNGGKQGSMTAEQLFEQALAKVESSSIRQWANSERNKPLWLQMAQGAVVKHNGQPDVSLFSALIVSTAIGL